MWIRLESLISFFNFIFQLFLNGWLEVFLQLSNKGAIRIFKQLLTVHQRWYMLRKTQPTSNSLHNRLYTLYSSVEHCQLRYHLRLLQRNKQQFIWITCRIHLRFNWFSIPPLIGSFKSWHGYNHHIRCRDAVWDYSYLVLFEDEQRSIVLFVKI